MTYYSESTFCLCGYAYTTCESIFGAITYAIAPATCPVTRV